MFLPQAIITVMSQFQPAFSAPTFRKGMVLVVGTLLGRGRRTVTGALRQVGLAERGDWAKYHHVLNRAKWSSLQVARILLRLLVQRFVPQAGWVELVLDETLERRWGQRITTWSGSAKNGVTGGTVWPQVRD
jgi:DDE superfamily endonuclease